MNIDSRDQLLINQGLIQIVKQLQDKPDAFFQSLSPAQIDLCRRCIADIKPLDTLSTAVSSKDIPDLEALCLLASSYPNDTNSEKGNNKKLRSSVQKVFQQYHKGFTELTKLLEAKAKAKEEVDLPKEGDLTVINLPPEIGELIISMTDHKTLLAFNCVSKTAQNWIGSMNDSPTVLLAFAKLMGIENVKTEDAKVAIEKLRHDLTPVSHINLHSRHHPYETDKRFTKVIDLRTVADLGRGLLSREDMQLIPAWKHAEKILSFWRDISVQVGTSSDEFDFYVDPIDDLIKLKDAHQRINKSKKMASWREENKERLAKLKYLELKQWKCEDLIVSETLRFCTSLTELNLKRIQPLKSVDFILDLPSLQFFAFDGDMDFKSLQMFEKLRNKEHLKFRPRSLQERLRNLCSQDCKRTPIKFPKFIQSSFQGDPDNLATKFQDFLTIEEMFFLVEALEARDTLVVWDMLLKSIDKRIDLTQYCRTCDSMVRKAKEFPSWLEENKEALKRITILELNALNLMCLPEAIWGIGFQLEVLNLGYNDDLIFPEELLSLKSSLKEFEYDQYTVPEFVLELSEIACKRFV